MKKYIAVLFLAFLVIPSFVKASDVNSQTVTLSKGWNIISTPKVLSSHQFSTDPTSNNFDIYLLDPTSSSGWQTMQGAGQTEFQPLFAYFINNKTETSQTLQLNYNFNLEPNQRLFQRTLNPGWNTVGIASPGYALLQGSASTDTNNPSNILSSIVGSISQVIDFTSGNTNLDLPSISNTWLSKTVADANSLNDFRELKGYGVFVTSATNNYTGSENLPVPVITLKGASTVHLTVGDTYIDAGATASDYIDGDITANIVVINPVNTSVAGTYTITYNVSDSSSKNAQQVTRTVIISDAYNTNLKISADSSNPTSSTVKVSTTANTNNVVLLKGKMVLDGTSDVWLDELPVTFVASATSISAITSSVKLTIDGKVYTETTGSNCVNTCDANTTSVITFNNLDLTIVAGSTIYFTVSADINDIESTIVQATDFEEGDGLLASVSSTNRGNIVAENEQGDQLTDNTEMTGSATGSVQAFRSFSLDVALVSTSTQFVAGSAGSTTSTPIADSGIFSITFDVTANGSDIYVDSSNPSESGSASITDLLITTGGSGTLTVATIQNITGGSTAPEAVSSSAGQYIVRDGTTQRFIITARVIATTSGNFSVRIDPATYGISYALTDIDGDLSYTTGLTAFHTSNLYLTKY